MKTVILWYNNRKYTNELECENMWRQLKHLWYLMWFNMAWTRLIYLFYDAVNVLYSSECWTLEFFDLNII